MAEKTTTLLTREGKDSIAAALYSVSSVMSLYDVIHDGLSASAASEFNSKQLKASAVQVKQIGAFSEHQMERLNKQFLAAQQAGFVKGNIGFNGSAVDIMSDAIAQGEAEKASQRFQYKGQIAQKEAQARILKKQAEQQKVSTVISGVATAGDRLFTALKEFY